MIKANFDTYSNYVTDSLYQWDINRVLSVSGLNLSTAPEVHFSNANMDRAIVRPATLEKNVVSVTIPNSILQDPITITAHIGIYEGDTFKVVERVLIPVYPKARPLDYTFEDTDGEIYSYNKLENIMSSLATKSEVSAIRANISNIVAANNDTEGNSELVDIRLGADDTLYTSAGEAVRNQTQQLATRVNELNISQIENYDFMDNGVNDGLIVADYSDKTRETYSNMSNCETILATPSQAYGNGFVAPKNILITGIRLKSETTATQFSIFVFDSNDQLVNSYINLTPRIIDNVIILDESIELKTGSYILIRYLNGNGYYYRASTNIYTEYQPGTNSLVKSPIRLGIELVYTAKTYKLVKPYGDSIVHPSDFILPKCKDGEGEFTFIGRWFDKEIGDTTRKCTNADGSSILFKTRGSTTINVGLYSLSEPTYTPYFAYSVDGGEFIRQKITDTTITLPDENDHIVWIVVDGMGENDPQSGGKWYGTVGVYFVGVTNGEKNALEYRNKKIMFVGDSIVEGINVLGNGANANVNSAINGFAFRTARLLNSIPLMCGYGGTAVLGNASFHKPIDAIDYNMENVLVNEQDPDIIVVAHGYNDGSLVSNGAYTIKQFKAGYNALLDRIKIKYSGVPIVCLIPFKQSLKDEIKECADNRTYCYVVDTESWDITYTDSAHPDVIGSETASLELSDNLIKIFGKQYFYDV